MIRISEVNCLFILKTFFSPSSGYGTWVWVKTPGEVLDLFFPKKDGEKVTLIIKSYIKPSFSVKKKRIDDLLSIKVCINISITLVVQNRVSFAPEMKTYLFILGPTDLYRFFPVQW